MQKVLLALRDSLWLVPLLCMIGGAGLCIGAATIDRATGNALVPSWLTGTPSAAQTVLSTIVTSLVTLITLVLTVITVAVQLAMGQFSPRIVRALLHDRLSQYTHGLFAATLVYALLAIPQVDDSADGGHVPGLTMLLAYLLMLASIVALVLYVHHAGQTLRVAGLIDLVGDHLHEELNRAYPANPTAPADPDPRVILAHKPGVVVQIDVPGLVAAATDAGCTLRLVPAMGDFVCANAPLLLIDGNDHVRVDAPHIASLVVLGDERSYRDDPAYGFRQLVDIAERGVSDPFSDPTTTVQAVDRLHDALRQLATRTIPAGEHHDKLGTLRLVTPALDWTGYVRLAFDEIRIAGAGSPQVARRLRAALEDLQTVAPAPRQPELNRQLDLLTLDVQRSFDNDSDITNALTADQQGLGSGPDLIHGGSMSASRGTRPPAQAMTTPPNSHSPRLSLRKRSLAVSDPPHPGGTGA
ncbi:MAG: DUF2254 domain-containing protein [Jiangellaceae bacterium]